MIYETDEEILFMLKKKYPNFRNYPKSSTILFSDKIINNKTVCNLIGNYLREHI